MRRLLHAVLGIWLLSIIGEQLYSEVFTIPLVSWGVSVVLGVLIPLGVIGAIRHYSRTKEKGAVIALIVYGIVVSLFLALPLVNVFIGSFTLRNSEELVQNDMAARLAINMVTSDDPSVRKSCAQMLLVDYNVKTSYRDKDGEQVEYSPSRLDNKRIKKRERAKKFRAQENEAILRMSHRYIYLITIFILMNLIVFSVGMWLEQKRENE